MKILLLLLLLFPKIGLANDFTTPKGLEGAVEFWILIFSEYSREQVVFHHREKPEIIYSVLDFTQLKEESSERTYWDKREKQVTKEKNSIKKAIQKLSNGGVPSGELEIHISKILTSKKELKGALGPKMIRAQRGIKDKFANAIQRSGRYMYVIEAIFEAEGLPKELTRLPFVESSFNYEAYSSVGAAGMWQFIRSTGKRYLRINSNIDERLDAVSSSRAAAKYLKRNYEILKSWPLAVTAYNHGSGGMRRAIKQTGSRDIVEIIRRYQSRTFGFASKNFFAELIAANFVYNNRRDLFPEVLPEPPLRFDEVLLESSLRVKDVMKLTSTSEAELKKLNYGFRKSIWNNRARIPSGVFLKVPEGKGALMSKDAIKVALAESTKVYEKKLKNVQKFNKSFTYKVQRGDTLSGIARKYGVSVTALRRNNNISRKGIIYAGQKIAIPSNIKTHKVKKGESLGRIARLYGSNIKAITRANNIKNPRLIKVGQVLRIPN